MDARRLIFAFLLMGSACMQIAKADTTLPDGQVNIAPVQAPAAGSGTSPTPTTVLVQNKLSAPINVFQQGTKNVVKAGDTWNSEYSKGVVTVTTTSTESSIKFVISEVRSTRCFADLCLTVQ